MPLVEMGNRDPKLMTVDLDSDDEEEDKRDIKKLRAWVSSISALTSLSEFALTRISDSCLEERVTPCPCDEECDLSSCGSSCSYISTGEIDSNRTLLPEDGFPTMHVSHDVVPERFLSVGLQTDPIEMQTNCTQTHRRRRGVAKLGIFSPKKTASVQSAQKTSSLLLAQKTSSLLSAQKTSSLLSPLKTGSVLSAQKTGSVLSAQRTTSVQSATDNADTSQHDNESLF